MIFYLALFIFLLLIELFYFKVADKFNIIDRPNERSSHNELTIRGGGVIFFVSVAGFYLRSDFAFTYFFIGLSIASIVSFWDDVISLPAKFRFIFHFCAIAFILCELKIDFASLFYFTLLLIGVGILNVYNFMDGINGITGGYSMVTILTFLYINNKVDSFITNDLLFVVLVGLFVFNIFNFRNKAKCFAGDVGSISIAFVIIFLLFKLISKNYQFEYVFLLLVYGIDTFMTLIERIIKKQNIFKAHNMHLYQLLVRNKIIKVSHLQVSVLYMILQFIVNIIVISFLNTSGQTRFLSAILTWVYSNIKLYFN